ncbi:MAG: hypothetical protein LBV46_01850, partial [Bacteroidales bacterium]|nr:hypothetical protein [Bacteroidales bacterium]
KTEVKIVDEKPLLSQFIPFLQTRDNLPLNTTQKQTFSPLSPPPLLLTGRNFINFTHQRVFYACA